MLTPADEQIGRLATERPEIPHRNVTAQTASATDPGIFETGLRACVARAAHYLGRDTECSGAPPALLSFDRLFARSFTGPEARRLVRERLDADPGFDLADEAFSAMVSLSLLPSPASPAQRALVDRLAAQIETCRWRGRYRFFADANGFPADTDCTAIATSALFEHGLLSAAELDTRVRELLLAAALATGVAQQQGRGDDGDLHPHTFMVYWEDGAEPATTARGRKQDAVACANALYTVELNGPQTGEKAATVIRETTGYLLGHLDSGRYLGGTRYYPSPEAFLYAVSRICARFPRSASARVLAAPVRRALEEREANAPVRAMAAEPGTSLAIAHRVLAADNLDSTAGQAQRRALLTGAQRPDGSWPACPHYRMGRFPVYFGSPYLTTMFAHAALRSRGTPDPTSEGSDDPPAATQPAHTRACPAPVLGLPAANPERRRRLGTAAGTRERPHQQLLLPDRARQTGTDRGPARRHGVSARPVPAHCGHQIAARRRRPAPDPLRRPGSREFVRTAGTVLGGTGPLAQPEAGAVNAHPSIKPMVQAWVHDRRLARSSSRRTPWPRRGPSPAPPETPQPSSWRSPPWTCFCGAST